MLRLHFAIMLLTALLLLGSSVPSSAASLVMNSEKNDLPIGGELQDDQNISLEDGEQIRVINLETGETRTLRGPYSGAVSQYEDPCKVPGASFKSCHPRKNQDLGGTRVINPE